MKYNEMYAERRAYKRFGSVVKVIVAGAAVALACTVQAASYTLTLKSTSAKRGTVSGGGAYESGTKVTIRAKKKSGYAFAGWFKNKSCTTALNPKGYDNRKATVKMSMPAKDTKVYAKFVTKSEAKKSLKFSSSTKKLATTAKKVTAGDDFSLKLGISSDTLPTVTAKGLPKGLKIDKTTGKITGVLKEAGSFEATVTVKDAAGNKISQKVKIDVAVQSWAVGTFNGYVYIDGSSQGSLLQFSVGTTGRITGKVAYKGKSYPFSSHYASFDWNKAIFTPTFVFSSTKAYSPGKITVYCVTPENPSGAFSIVEAIKLAEIEDVLKTFCAQKRLGVIRTGGALAGANGKTFKFTGGAANSGLSSGDTLTIGLKNDVAWVKEGSTVGGKKLSVTELPMFLTFWWIDGTVEYFEYHVYIFDYVANYSKKLIVTIPVDNYGDGSVITKDITAEFEK